jgi:hypothetical protein
LNTPALYGSKNKNRPKNCPNFSKMSISRDFMVPV